MRTLPIQIYIKLLVILSIILALFITACNNLKNNSKCNAQTSSSDFLPPPTTDVTTDVYLDATLSMQGFTNSETFSYYQQTIPLLESAVIKTWKNGAVNFNKFGDKIESLSGRSFLEANKAVFYSDTTYNRKTLIENVIESADANKLNIILTDLFQDNADINQLVEKIKNKFIVNDKAVGILAVKSQFNGKVYDVGSKNYSFIYKTADDSALRPFYILAFGSHSDIAAYFDALENSGIKDFPVKERIIFSRFLTDKPVTFLNSETVDIKNLNDVSEVLVKSNGNASEYKELKVVNKKKQSDFITKLPFEKLPNTIEFGNELEPEIQSWTCNKNENNDSNLADSLSFASNPNAKNALNISAALADSKTIEFNLTVNPEKFDNEDVNCFRIVLRPQKFMLPKWVDEWNMTDEQIDAWYKSPASFEGSKTYNLKRFIQDLWTTTGKTHLPKVADFYLYIKPD